MKEPTPAVKKTLGFQEEVQKAFMQRMKDNNNPEEIMEFLLEELQKRYQDMTHAELVEVAAAMNRELIISALKSTLRLLLSNCPN